jgi:hypothetical protein
MNPGPSVWPNGTYAHRVGISFHAVGHDVSLGDVGSENWESIRHSACTSGAPYVTKTAWELPQIAQVVDAVAKNTLEGTSSETAVASLEHAMSLPSDFEFDRDISATARLEARYLRQQLFGKGTSFACALCDRILPVTLLVTAHIKKRSECDEDEKGDPNVVMSNCLFGCDALYERGFVTVDGSGLIRVGTGIPGTDPDLMWDLISGSAIEIDSPCSIFGAKTKNYFAWHYSRYGWTSV